MRYYMLSVVCYLQKCYLWTCDMRNRDIGHEAISGSHRCIDLTPMDSSSVDCFSSEL